MEAALLNTRSWTIALTTGLAAILVVWDVGVASNAVKDDTISELLRDLAQNWRVLPFVLGGIMGHLFWNKGERLPGDFKPKAIVATVVAVAGSDMAAQAAGVHAPVGAPMLALLAGIGAGAKLWPQQKARVD